MLEELQNHLDKQFPFLKDKKLLLAVSGGIDSMVMLDLFRQLPYKISAAHCNFQLRDLESFEDEKFVIEYADEYERLVLADVPGLIAGASHGWA